MEKVQTLELKHLAPYLPYGLKITTFDANNGFYKLEMGLDDEDNDIFPIQFVKGNKDSKPILRPLSDLTKEIEVNEERFVPIERIINERDCDAEYDFIEALEDDINSMDEKILFAPYSVMDKFLEWHFDVFGLIEKGLAISYNDLK